MMEGEKRFVSVSIPKINELRCLIGRVDPNSETRDSSVESLFHYRILRCRSLIHSLPEIIASPGIIGRRFDDPSKIYILTKNEFLSTGKIQKKLDDMRIKYIEPLQVTSQVYEECLLYTMLTKLSPSWNKVEKYLVAGENFLDSISAPTKAIKLDVAIDGKHSRLAVSPACVMVPAPLCLSYFSLPPKIVEDFITNDKGFIQLSYSQAHTWVFVLPSLKKGRVVSMSREIPESCPFRNYEHLREHWKNMYGYQLPKTDLGLIYYQLSFPGLGSGAFTYPSCCVASGKLSLLNLKNGDDVASQFLKNLIETVPEVCGMEFKTEENSSVLAPCDRLEENQKENIPKFSQNAAKIFNPTGFGTPLDFLSRDFYSGSSGCGALSTISNGPSESSKPRHDIIKGKSLREALKMKPFLQFRSSNKRHSTLFSNEFICQVEKKRLAEVKIETEENDELLRSRKSFDLKKNFRPSSEGIVDPKPEAEKTCGIEDGVEVKSRYFEDFAPSKVEEATAAKSSAPKLNLRRLSNKKSKVRGADSKTKDISSYFREMKKQVKVPEVKRNRSETLTPARLVQTHLNFLKTSENVESCVETKKMKFIKET